MATGPNTKILDNIMKNMMSEDHDPLSPLIDRYLIRRERPEYAHLRIPQYTLDLKERPRPLGRLSPSGLCGCERQAVFKFLGVEGKKKLDPDVMLIFEDGHWRHHKWQWMLSEMESILGSENFRCLSIELPIRIGSLYVAGALDALVEIRYRGGMERWVIDIKGINSFGFQDVYGKQQPKKEHVEQLIAYMKAKKCRRGALLYEDKNSNRYVVFVIEFSEEEWKVVKKWCKRVTKFIRHRELPRIHPECDNGSFLYEKCPYKGLCFGTKTEASVERLAFRNFTSLDDLWQQGLEIEENG